MIKLGTSDRRNEIRRVVYLKGSVTTSELAGLFNVSSETIRQDIIALERIGLVDKTHGGATLKDEYSEIAFYEKSAKSHIQKQAIANEALKRVREGMSIMLDSGSTIVELAKSLAIYSKLRIFTNSIHAALILNTSDNEVYIIGGQLRKSSSASVGMWGAEQCAGLTVDIAFMGCTSFGVEEGTSVDGADEAEIKKALLKTGNKNILLADSSKSEEIATFRFATWDDYDELITDDGVDLDAASGLSDKVKLTYVDTSS